jgi:hypothetical protein
MPHSSSVNVPLSGTIFNHFKRKAVYMTIGVVNVSTKDNYKISHALEGILWSTYVTATHANKVQSVVKKSLITEAFIIDETDTVLVGNEYVLYVDPLTNNYYLREVDEFFGKMDYTKYPDVPNVQEYRFEYFPPNRVTP